MRFEKMVIRFEKIVEIPQFVICTFAFQIENRTNKK